MTKKTRTILFLVCLFLFLLIAPSAVFYSQGYRIDFENKKFTQTGAFYFKVLPKSVEVYLNGKLIKKTDFFFGTALIENLLPKKYQIKIIKEGYHSWQKNLEIKEKQVTEAKNIVLVPENPKFVVLSTDEKEINDILYKLKAEREKNKIERPPALLDETLNTTSSYQVVRENVFWLSKEQHFYRKKLQVNTQKELIAQNIKSFEISPDLKKIVYFNNNEVWITFLEDELGQPQKKAGDQLLVARFREKIGQVFWYTSHYLIFNVENKIKIAEIDDRDRINIVDLAEFPPTTSGGGPKIFWTPPPYHPQRLYILSEGNLFVSESLLK